MKQRVWINDLEDRIIENNQAGQMRRKKNIQIENCLREPSDSIKHSNIPIIGISEEEREKQAKMYLKR